VYTHSPFLPLPLLSLYLYLYLYLSPSPSISTSTITSPSLVPALLSPPPFLLPFLFQEIATLRELIDVVRKRDIELERCRTVIDDQHDQLKERNTEIQKLKERLKMACDTSIASLRYV
jgi:hypothetical protein